MKKKKNKFESIAKVVFLFAIAMIVSNNIIQFFENLTKSYGVGVFIFNVLIAFLYPEIVRWFK